MIGLLYNEITKRAPVYPTATQRVISYVRDLLTPAQADEPALLPHERYSEGAVPTLNLWELECEGREKVEAVANAIADDNQWPTIERYTQKYQGYYAKITPRHNFLKVVRADWVCYFPLRQCRNSLYDNPFYNVERIYAIPGSRDDITKKAKRKSSRAKAA